MRYYFNSETQTSFWLYCFPSLMCVHAYIQKQELSVRIFLSHSPLISLKVFWIIIFIAYMWVVGVCAYESRYLQRPESPGAAATGACELFNLGVVNTLNHWMLLGFLTLPGAQKLSYTGWSASLRDPPVSASMVLGWSLDSDLPACT